MRKTKEMRLREQVLMLQLKNLKRIYEKKKKKEAFVRSNLKRILSLSTEGWPHTKNMKDYIKWIDIIFEAKLKGIYSIGTANCDIISNLSRFAKEYSGTTKQETK